jgi:hypothetical protein
MIASDGLVTAILDDDLPSPARRGAGRPCSTDSSTRSSAPDCHDSPAMISLTDEQLRLVMELAALIPVEQRDEFLRGRRNSSFAVMFTVVSAPPLCRDAAAHCALDHGTRRRGFTGIAVRTPSWT